MDSATRMLLERQRDLLAAEVRRLDLEKRDRIRVVTTDPGFNPLTHSMDSQVANLVSRQNALIGQIQEIERKLGQ